jgi:hypothetical protein
MYPMTIIMNCPETPMLITECHRAQNGLASERRVSRSDLAVVWLERGATPELP